MTPAKRRNVYVEGKIGPAPIKAALGFLLDACGKLNAKEIWIVCHTQAALTGTTMLAEAVGGQFVEALRKRQSVSVNGTRVIAYTERQLPVVGNGSPVIALHTSSKLLAKVDAMVQVPILVVVPWNAEADTEGWRKTRSPEVIAPGASSDGEK